MVDDDVNIQFHFQLQFTVPKFNSKSLAKSSIGYVSTSVAKRRYFEHA